MGEAVRGAALAVLVALQLLPVLPRGDGPGEQLPEQVAEEIVLGEDRGAVVIALAAELGGDAQQVRAARRQRVKLAAALTRARVNLVDLARGILDARQHIVVTRRGGALRLGHELAEAGGGEALRQRVDGGGQVLVIAVGQPGDRVRELVEGRLALADGCFDLRQALLESCDPG